ncbi:MAG: acyltransferase [Gordonia polyisoprenivorans]|nr:acyltransferase [Gordonia polyisoprenivorans]
MILQFVRRRVEATYSARRGIDGGFDPLMTDLDVALLVRRRLVGKLRAVGRQAPQAFVGRRVQLRNRGHLTIGANVAIGDDVDIDALSRDGVRLGDACTIDKFAIIRGSGGPRRLGRGVELSERCAVGVANFIHGGGGVFIGRDTLLGPGVQIFSEHHVMSDRDTAIIEQTEFEAPVHIDQDVFIGAGSVILGPVRIGRGAIISAGAVVTSDVEPFSVVAGAPARKIRDRGAGGKRT